MSQQASHGVDLLIPIVGHQACSGETAKVFLQSLNGAQESSLRRGNTLAPGVASQLTPGLLVACAGLALVHVLIAFLLLRELLGGAVLGDWRAFYSAGVIVRGPHADELYLLARQTTVQYELLARGPIDTYPLPAFAAYVFLPFTYLPYAASYVAWFSLNLGLIAILAKCVWGYLDAAPRRTRAVLIAGIIASTPMMKLLFLGQVDLIVMAALVLSFCLMRSGRPGLAGVALALGLLKPQLVVGAVLFLAVTKQWRALSAFGIAAAVLFGTPVLFLGPHLVVDQMRLIRSTPDSFSPGIMANIRGMLIVLTGSDRIQLWLPATVIAGTTTLLVSVRAWSGSNARDPQGWALATLLPLVAAPHLHLYTTVIASLALVLWCGEAARHGRLRLSDILIAYLAASALTMPALLAEPALAWPLLATAFVLVTRRWPSTSAARQTSAAQPPLVRSKAAAFLPA